MHGSHHTGDETVDTVAFLYQGNQSRDLTLVVVAAPEVNKDKFLESFNLILEGHQVADSLVSELSNQLMTKCNKQDGVDCSPFIGIVDILQTDVFLVLEQSVELRVMSMEPQF